MQKQRHLQGADIVTYTLKVPEELWQQLRRYAFEQNQSIAYSIQEAIEGLVSKQSWWRRK